MLIERGVKENIVLSPDDGANGGVLGQSSEADTNTQADDTTSAGTQKTDTQADDLDSGIQEGQTIPYDRFKQVNEKRKQTESELKALKAEVETIKQQSEGYQRLEGYLAANKNLNRKITSLIQDHANGKITEAKLEAELGKIEDKIDSGATNVTPQRNTKVDKITFAMYDNDLMSLISKDFEAEEDIKSIGKRVTRILNSDYPQWKDEYHPGLVRKVYKEAMDELESYHKKRMDTYSKNKDRDNLPDRKSPSSFHEEVSLDTAEQRTASLAKGLKGALKGV